MGENPGYEPSEHRPSPSGLTPALARDIRIDRAKRLARETRFTSAECRLLLEELDDTGASPETIAIVARALLDISSGTGRGSLDWSTIYWVSDRLRDVYRPGSVPTHR